VPLNRPAHSSFRWVIVALLFAASAINYLDRQMIGLLKPTLQGELNWTEIDYGDIVFWFQAAYAVGYLSSGRLIDRIGARLGLVVSMGIWTLAHMAHALARSAFGFSVARAALGFGEAGAFPGALKAVAEWLPQRERALAVGLFNAGTNIGAIITPLLVPIVTLAFGWRAAFVLTGAFGIAWMLVWHFVYRKPREQWRVSAAELELIESDRQNPTTPIPWSHLFKRKEVCAYGIAKFLTDPVWWVFLFWLPDFLTKTQGLNLKTFGIPLAAIYIASDVGAVAGGWVSSRLMRMGFSVNVSRKATMLAFALMALPVVFATKVTHLSSAVLILSLATAAHQGFASNLFTLPSDLFPKSVVGSVVGIGGAAGAVGGMLMARFAGWTLQTVGSYTPIFLTCAAMYLLALALIHVLCPRYRMVDAV
jgi:ACS family hexuronate transporter-like MFS transporter